MSQIENEYFTDLIEEGVRQASRAISEERKKYIATIIANGLTSDEINYIETKHIMKLLGELNDVEVIWLKSFSLTTSQEDQKFREEHKNILSPVFTNKRSEQSERDQAALQKSYKEHLTQLGLLDYKYQQTHKDRDKVETEFNRSTGGLKVSGYRITKIGELLLRKLDLISYQ